MEQFINTFFITLISSGALFLILGLVMKKFPPKEINAIYGYKTPTSMQSQEAWDFAQQYAGKRLIYAGLLLILMSLLSYFINSYSSSFQSLIALVAVIARLIFLFINTEKAIKKKFE